MNTIMKGFWLAVVLCAVVVNQGCGKSSDPLQPSVTVNNRTNEIVISVFNEGTQDSAWGTKYHNKHKCKVHIPSVVLRIKGNTLMTGVAVGVDFGADIGQCYYVGNTASPGVFTFLACTNSHISGEEINLDIDQDITVWSYVHINSNDSIVELILQGEMQ